MSTIFFKKKKIPSSFSYPLSVESIRDVSSYFIDILNFHTKEGESIIDVTCGQKYLWNSFINKKFLFHSPLTNRNITFSDIKNIDGNIIMDFLNPTIRTRYNCIIFDPPIYLESMILQIKEKKIMVGMIIL